MSTFEDQIESLDPQLFSGIVSETTEDDRRSFLALQSAVRAGRDEFCYLEIGSYLGGSIQPYLPDPLCSTIISVDKRPHLEPEARAIPDTRGKPWIYDQTTAAMIENLKKVAENELWKLQTYDDGVTGIDPATLRGKPRMCLIDGEHTDEAALADFRFCLSVAADVAVILFHDANLVFRGISKAIQQLEESGTPFLAYCLPTSLFVIELGGIRAFEHPAVQHQLAHNYRAYLPAMQFMERYRHFYHSPHGRMVRKLRGIVPDSLVRFLR